MPTDLRFADVRRDLEASGWRLVRINGSHHIFKKPGQSILVVPVHAGRVKGVYGKKIKQACEK